MKPLIVLLATFIISSIILALTKKKINYMLAGRISMACMLLFTAIGHFAFVEGMSAMIPDFIPYKTQIVVVTGILEILFAIGLLFPHAHYWTGCLIIVFFILILPANIYAAMHHLNYQTGEFNGPGLNYLWIRIPLQLLYILWVYFSAVRAKPNQVAAYSK